MQFGNKMFPYPVINKRKDRSEFKETSQFYLQVGRKNESPIKRYRNKLELKDVKFVIHDPMVERLLEKGFAKCAIIIECPSTMYRMSQEIYQEGHDIIINAQDVGNMVDVSAYIYCTTNGVVYESEDFLEEYAGYEFLLDTYDIIAIDDGYKFSVDHELGNTPNNSIFTLIKKNPDDGPYMDYETGIDKIVIRLPEEQYNQYVYLQDSDELKHIFLSSLVLPILLDIFNDFFGVESMYESLQEYKWFRSMSYSYQEATGEPLTDERLEAGNFMELAQIILDNCINQSFKDMYTLLEVPDEEN